MRSKQIGGELSVPSVPCAALLLNEQPKAGSGISFVVTNNFSRGANTVASRAQSVIRHNNHPLL
jgi:hypothetical protein